MAVEVSFVKFLTDMTPYIIIGVTYGVMLAKTRSDCIDMVHEMRVEKLKEMGDNIVQTHTIMKTLDNIYGTCMRNDRFEFVDVKKLKERKKRGRAEVNNKK